MLSDLRLRRNLINFCGVIMTKQKSEKIFSLLLNQTQLEKVNQVVMESKNKQEIRGKNKPKDCQPNKKKIMEIIQINFTN